MQHEIVMEEIMCNIYRLRQPIKNQLYNLKQMFDTLSFQIKKKKIFFCADNNVICYSQTLLEVLST